MDFAQIVDEVAKEYAEHVESNINSIYRHIFLGSHSPTQTVQGIADSIKEAYVRGAEAAHKYIMTSMCTIYDKVFMPELYNRIRDALDKEGLQLPLLDIQAEARLDYRTVLARNELEKPGEGWKKE